MKVHILHLQPNLRGRIVDHIVELQANHLCGKYFDLAWDPHHQFLILKMGRN